MRSQVPTPYTAHRHPYPTRYHGGIWVRPVFGLPYIHKVQAVFRPVEFYSSYGKRGETVYAGLGAMPDPYALRKDERAFWRANQEVRPVVMNYGLFRTQGQGGGIFNSRLAGLGQSGGGLAVLGVFALGIAAGFVIHKYGTKKKRGK